MNRDTLKAFLDAHRKHVDVTLDLARAFYEANENHAERVKKGGMSKICLLAFVVNLGILARDYYEAPESFSLGSPNILIILTGIALGMLFASLSWGKIADGNAKEARDHLGLHVLDAQTCKATYDGIEALIDSDLIPEENKNEAIKLFLDTQSKTFFEEGEVFSVHDELANKKGKITIC